jgi:hypothetical protein
MLADPGIVNLETQSTFVLQDVRRVRPNGDVRQTEHVLQRSNTDCRVLSTYVRISDSPKHTDLCLN